MSHLGKIIAFIERGDTHRLEELMREADNEALRSLYHQYRNLSASHHFDFEIPTTSCPMDCVFLQKEPLFFFLHFLQGYAVNLNETSTKQFIKHLNDCYPCFEAYSAVFREYYQTLAQK